MRQRHLIYYPKLNDKHGDATKDWYVEYAFRLDINGELFKYRIYQGLCRNTPADERYKNAKEIVNYYTRYLKSGEYLNSIKNTSPVMVTETYRPEVTRHKEEHAKLMVRNLASKYLTEIRPSLRPASLRKYTGEFRIFCDWIEQHLDNRPAPAVERKDLQMFLNYLAEEPENGGRGLCHESILQYRMRIVAFFSWMEDYQIIQSTPAYKLRAGGKYVDCSPTLYEKDERTRLRDAILPRQPYLWLAIELMYYSAIRPGECRQLKVGDINKTDRTVTVRSEIAKNKRTQTVGVKSETIALMERLGVFSYDKDLYIFGHGGIPGTKMLGKSTMRERFLQYRRTLGIDESRTLYSWKHTGITDLLQNGANIFDVKDHARHADIQTTMEYTKKHVPKTHAFEEFVSL